MNLKNPIVRFLVSSWVAILVGAVALLALTLADLYLVGHSHESISREAFVFSPAGLHLSVFDVTFLTSVLGAWVGTWFLLRRAA